MGNIRLTALSACALLVFAAVSRAAPAPSYAVTDLGSFGNYSDALDVNNHGDVVGASHTQGTSILRPFLYRNGVMQDLGTLGGPQGLARAINDAAQVIGYADTAANQTHAFRYTAGVMQDLGTTGGSTSEAWGVNNHGEVAGVSWRTANFNYQAFYYHDGQMQNLGSLASGTIGNSHAYDVNDARKVVGYTYVPSGRYYPFVYANGQMTTIDVLPGGIEGRAVVINERDQIAGYSFQGGHHEVLLYDDGDLTAVTPGLPSSPHAPLDLNDNGEVVGMIGGTGGSYAFYWAGGTLHNLNDLTAGSGWDLIRASAINNHGQIVGFGTNPAGHPRAYLLTPVPEPSTLGGMAVSAALLVRRRARR